MSRGSDQPHHSCTATKEELRADGVKVTEDCPICAKRGVLCEVGCHPPQQAVPAPAPPVPLPSHPYLRRFYVLFNLQRPAEMLERGVREHIVAQMRGRPIGGMIYRSKLPDYDQCIIIRASGTPNSLNLFENTVLDITDERGAIYWEYTKTYKPDEALKSLISLEFSIGQSTHGAIRGPNSDPKYDNKSEKSSKSGKET